MVIPVAMDMAGAEGEAVVYQSGIDHQVLLRSVQEIVEITEVSVAAPHAVPRTVLIQHKHLPGAEPPLKLHQGHQVCEIQRSTCVDGMEKDCVDIKLIL